jgi:hypothetical protein
VFQVAPNTTGQARTATLSIGGQTFTVDQTAGATSAETLRIRFSTARRSISARCDLRGDVPPAVEIERRLG